MNVQQLDGRVRGAAAGLALGAGPAIARAGGGEPNFFGNQRVDVLNAIGSFPVDVNIDGIPHLVIPGVDGDGVVGFVDLLSLLADWDCVGCDSDINTDGVTDWLDLVDLLAARGPCP